MTEENTPTPHEIDGRITTLIRQRNAALDDVAFLAGRVAHLEHELAELRKEKAENDKPADAPQG